MSTQPSLFDIEQPARARTMDPETSHEAAASVKNVEAKRKAVLNTFLLWGEMTLEEMVANYKKCRGFPWQSDSGLRTRCCELVRLGLIEDTGHKRETKSGRSAIIWRKKA
jgi:hypothetical protein